LRDRTFRIKYPPVSSTGKQTPKAEKKPPVPVISKKSQRRIRFHERTGSFLGSSLFYLFEKKLENHGYI
jgi:hypothetical protein